MKMRSPFKLPSLFDLAEGLPPEPPAGEEAQGAGETSSASLPLAQEVKPPREGDDEALRLAERLSRALEPEVLERLRARAPIRVSRWETVLDPEKCARRTLEEIKTGESRMLEAAMARARRFLEAIEPLIEETGAEGKSPPRGGLNGGFKYESRCQSVVLASISGN